MEVYKLGKTIENQKIETQLALHQLNEEIVDLTLKRRKGIAIEENDTHQQEEDTIELFVDGNSSELNATAANLIEKNGSLTKEVRNLNIEKEVQ